MELLQVGAPLKWFLPSCVPQKKCSSKVESLWSGTPPRWSSSEVELLRSGSPLKWSSSEEELVYSQLPKEWISSEAELLWKKSAFKVELPWSGSSKVESLWRGAPPRWEVGLLLSGASQKWSFLKVELLKSKSSSKEGLLRSAVLQKWNSFAGWTWRSWKWNSSKKEFCFRGAPLKVFLKPS